MKGKIYKKLYNMLIKPLYLHKPENWPFKKWMDIIWDINNRKIFTGKVTEVFDIRGIILHRGLTIYIRIDNRNKIVDIESEKLIIRISLKEYNKIKQHIQEI